MLGPSEVILILVAALILFGPNKLPELARSIGLAMGEFRRAQRETELQIRKVTDIKVDPKIEQLAKELGIDTLEKTESQIMDEIKQLTSNSSSIQGTLK